MPEVIRQYRMNKFAIISLILSACLFCFAGLLYKILGNVFILIPIITIIVSVLSLVKPNRLHLESDGSLGSLGLIIGAIYVGIFIYQHL